MKNKSISEQLRLCGGETGGVGVCTNCAWNSGSAACIPRLMADAARELERRGERLLALAAERDALKKELELLRRRPVPPPNVR